MSKATMMEQRVVVGADEVLERIAAEIAAFVEGGPDLELTHLDYLDEVGADGGQVEMVRAQWALARKGRPMVTLVRPKPVAAVPKVAVVKVEPKPVVADKALVLNPNAPYDIAGEYIKRHCMLGNDCVMWYWQDQFYRWDGRVYTAVYDKALEGQLYAFLDKALRSSGGGQVRFQPTPKNVADVMHGLKSRLSLGLECQPPMWLSTGERATEWVVFQNRIVNVHTEETKPLSPDLWALSALSFAWDPEATCDVWEHFLWDVFDGDQQSVDFVEQWIGYCMTEETKFQKGAMFIGPKRSGKGTISYVIQQLVGLANFVGLSFSTWIYSENSKEVLIGKRAGVFADVRFKPGKSYGKNYDPGGITHTGAEMLLNTIGEDTATIGRKYKSPWVGQLRIKLTLISNEVPNLNDSSGVLPTRFIKLNFPKSFYGHEDINLRSKLSAELPGIAVRCVRAYADLNEQGEFVQPKLADTLERDVLTASDPFSAMVAACFVADLEGKVTVAELVVTAQAYLGAIGRPDEAERVRDNNIISRLRGCDGFERVDKAPREHGKTRRYSGVRIRPRKEWKEALE